MLAPALVATVLGAVFGLSAQPQHDLDSAHLGPAVPQGSMDAVLAHTRRAAIIEAELDRMAAPPSPDRARARAGGREHTTVAPKAAQPANADAGSTTASPSAVSVAVAYTAGASTMERLLALCDGPVAITFPGIGPRLLAEHDYCGGTWILALQPGDIVDISGGGIGGRYRVNGNIKVVDENSSAAVLEGMGAVVAQTCRPDGATYRLVGLSRTS